MEELIIDTQQWWLTNLARISSLSSFQYPSYMVQSGASRSLVIHTLSHHGLPRYQQVKALNLSTYILLLLQQMSQLRTTCWPEKDRFGWSESGRVSVVLCKNCAAIPKVQWGEGSFHFHFPFWSQIFLSCILQFIRRSYQTSYIK